ncbi:MAG TPA: YicC/YloC family endoribonuclease [Gemmatimonadaceae bacterium]|nr:YicC/YloC family endoribonuclease [Gemmatimonadaceae bacterium]
MIRSMTGFGSAEGEVGGALVAVEVRSVNHRFFNPSIKLPSEFGRFEGEVRDTIRKGVSRGHVTLVARISREQAEGRIDETRFASYVQQLRELQQRYALDAALDVGTILRLPDVLGSRENGAESAGNPQDLIEIVSRAVAGLDAMRVAEGERLAAYILERLQVIEQAVERIATRAPERLVEQRERLRQAVQELAGGVTLDDQRLAQEIAILADRLDVSEEVSRFQSHFEAFRATLKSPPNDGVGKRLGFLLQELLREANTTGSKANDATMLQDVLGIKEELERIREQVENLE